MVVTCSSWDFLQTWALQVKKATSQTKFFLWCYDAVHHIDPKQRHIYLFMDGVTGWEDEGHEVWRKRKAKMGNNVDMLNVIRNSSICSRHLDKEKINTDSSTSGDPIYFAWNNRRKSLARGRPERHKSAKLRMSVVAALLHVWLPCTWVASIRIY